MLVAELKSEPGVVVRVLNHFQHAMFCLLVLMCFGDGLEEKQIKQIEEVQRRSMLGLRRFRVLNFWPRLSKLVLRKRWKEFYELCECRKRVLIPLIRARLNPGPQRVVSPPQLLLASQICRASPSFLFPLARPPIYSLSSASFLFHLSTPRSRNQIEAPSFYVSETHIPSLLLPLPILLLFDSSSCSGSGGRIMHGIRRKIGVGWWENRGRLI